MSVPPVRLSLEILPGSIGEKPNKRGLPTLCPSQAIFLPGGYSGGETPDPIPNSEVKPSSADGTARETEWESRSLPGFLYLDES